MMSKNKVSRVTFSRRRSRYLAWKCYRKWRLANG